MQIFRSQIQIRTFVQNCQLLGQSIGLVPTMGALHEGHLALIAESKKFSKITIASIFVNPLQFNNPTDFEKYPNVLDEDIHLLTKAGCDVLFAPSVSEVYSSLTTLKFDFGDLETQMEGKYRKGHFNGVAVVVSKLFNLIQPNLAFFGQKDLQQCAIVKCLVKDLSFPIQVNIVNTLREADGLAMSSRNRRLSPNGRARASEIYESLQLAYSLKNSSIEEIKLVIQEFYASRPYFNLEYFEICEPNTLKLFQNGIIEGEAAFCIAVYLEEVRLIDNFIG